MILRFQTTWLSSQYVPDADYVYTNIYLLCVICLHFVCMIRDVVSCNVSD